MPHDVVAAWAVLRLPIAGVATQAGSAAIGMAKAVSLLFFVGTTCPAFDRIDVELVGRYAKAEAEVGETSFGKRMFSGLLADELLRRGREVDAAGARNWCAARKETFKGMGLSAFYR